jgi:NADH dehydrogenase
MQKRLVIIGAGFAGMYAAISAARLRHLQGVSPDDLEIALISPEPFLVIRPRLYEPKPETMKAPLTELLQEMDVRYVQGSVETIDSASGLASFVGPEGKLETDWSSLPAAPVSAPTFPALRSTHLAST